MVVAWQKYYQTRDVLTAIHVVIRYSIAIRCLGTAQTAAFLVLTPLFALVGGIFFQVKLLAMEASQDGRQ